MQALGPHGEGLTNEDPGIVQRECCYRHFPDQGQERGTKGERLRYLFRCFFVFFGGRLAVPGYGGASRVALRLSLGASA